MESTKAYIAYFDILGYKATMENESEIESLFGSVLELSSAVAGLSSQEELGEFGFSTRAFSDNFMIVVVPSEDHAGEDVQIALLLTVLSYIQVRLLAHFGFLIRGSIVYGDIFMNESIVFGQGLIDAVMAEEAARMPRIAIDNAAYARMAKYAKNDLLQEMVRLDADDVRYVNSFEILEDFATSNFLCDAVRHCSENGIAVTQDELRAAVERNVKRECRYPKNARRKDTIAVREATIAKYMWLLAKFDAFCRDRGQAGCGIAYSYELNERVVKCEIALQDGPA